MDQIELLNAVQSIAGQADDDVLCSDLHHANSKLHPCNIATYQRIAYFNASQLGHDLVQRASKRYACAERFVLPEPAPLPMPLSDAIDARRSARKFSGRPLPLTVISSLLRYANGINPAAPPRRAIPSGGALYPTEMYVLPLDVPDLPEGAFHYDVTRHELEQMSESPAEPLLRTVCQPDIQMGAVSAAFVITAVFERQQVKYGERAYRFTLIECGHLAQNLLLACAALGLAALPLGGFVDDDVNRYLRVDGQREAALYVVLVS